MLIWGRVGPAVVDYQSHGLFCAEGVALGFSAKCRCKCAVNNRALAARRLQKVL